MEQTQTTTTTKTTATEQNIAERYLGLLERMERNQAVLQNQLIDGQAALRDAEARASRFEANQAALRQQAEEAAKKAAEATKKADEFEAKVKTAETQLEDLKKNGAVDAKAPGRRIVDRVGETAASRLADALEKNKMDDVQKALNECHEGMARALADGKKVEGNVVEFYHIDKSVMHWSVAAVAVVGIGVTVGVGYYAYNKGREAGQLDMVDGKFTYEMHGKR